MTVKELRAELLKYDSDLNIIIFCPECKTLTGIAQAKGSRIPDASQWSLVMNGPCCLQINTEDS